MATKTISINEEAYNRLLRLKKENESFSMVINRIAKRKKLSDFAGILSEKEAQKMKKSIHEFRKEDNKLFVEKMKRLFN